MSSYVVWLDSEKAKVFNLSEQGVIKSRVDHTHTDHHTHAKGDDHTSEEKFYHGLALKLEEAEEVLIIGPGQAKNHFKSHIAKHNHHDLAKKIVGVEPADHPTDNQITALARKFFKKIHLYNT